MKEWRAIFLVAAVLPVGAATLIAQNVMIYAGGLGPYAVLASLVILSSLLSQGLDGAPAVVLLTPVVLATAQGVGVSPYPLMMGVALAASAAFMTPFSHKANLLVMGAGEYRSWDYIKVGTPLTIVILAALILMVPVFFPFYGPPIGGFNHRGHGEHRGLFWDYFNAKVARVAKEFRDSITKSSIDS